ncbi:MAG: cobalt ECF transporter T component CbiQ, partial [Desulfobacterales bacterium]
MGNDFVAKTLAETTRAIEYSIFANQYAAKKGFMQRIDPRVKLLTTFTILIIIGLTQRLVPLLVLYVGTLILAIFSRVSFGFFIKRVWVFIPLFTGIVALPAVFNIVTPGRSLFTVISFLSPHTFGPFHIPQNITITAQGVSGVAILVMRVATSVSMAILLVVTTEWIRLLKALYVLKTPEVIILILAMTYRYIHLFLRTVEGMFLAKKSREISDLKMKEEHGWIASRLGVLVGKSYRLSNEVHLAMTSRGWTGNPTIMDDFTINRIDALW